MLEALLYVAMNQEINQMIKRVDEKNEKVLEEIKRKYDQAQAENQTFSRLRSFMGDVNNQLKKEKGLESDQKEAGDLQWRMEEVFKKVFSVTAPIGIRGDNQLADFVSFSQPVSLNLVMSLDDLPSPELPRMFKQSASSQIINFLKVRPDNVFEPWDIPAVGSGSLSVQRIFEEIKKKHDIESMSLNGVEIYNDQNRTPFESDRKLEFVDNDRHDELEIRISFPYGKSDRSMHYRITQKIDRVTVENVTAGTSSSDPLGIKKIIVEDVMTAASPNIKNTVKSKKIEDVEKGKVPANRYTLEIGNWINDPEDRGQSAMNVLKKEIEQSMHNFMQRFVEEHIQAIKVSVNELLSDDQLNALSQQIWNAVSFESGIYTTVETGDQQYLSVWPVINQDQIEEGKLLKVKIASSDIQASIKAQELPGIVQNLIITLFLRNVEFAKKVAQYLHDAYYISVGEEVPAFITEKDTGEDINRKVGQNLPGFIAFLEGIVNIGTETQQTPFQVLDDIVNDRFSNTDQRMVELAQIAHATWLATQPFLGVNRLKRPVVQTWLTLSNPEKEKDFVQVKSAAVFFLSQLQETIKNIESEENRKAVSQQAQKILNLVKQTSIITSQDEKRLIDAIETVVFFHRNQERKDGSEYSFHPLKVMEINRNSFENRDLFMDIVALFHDAREDQSMFYEASKNYNAWQLSQMVEGLGKQSQMQQESLLKLAIRLLSKLEGAKYADLKDPILEMYKRLSDPRKVYPPRDGQLGYNDAFVRGLQTVKMSDIIMNWGDMRSVFDHKKDLSEEDLNFPKEFFEKILEKAIPIMVEGSNVLTNKDKEIFYSALIEKTKEYSALKEEKYKALAKAAEEALGRLEQYAEGSGEVKHASSQMINLLSSQIINFLKVRPGNVFEPWDIPAVGSGSLSVQRILEEIKRKHDVESMFLNGVEIYNDQNRTPFESDRKLEFVNNDRHDELEIRISFPYGKSDMSMHYRITQKIDRVTVESVTAGTSSSDPLGIKKIIIEDVIGPEIVPDFGLWDIPAVGSGSLSVQRIFEEIKKKHDIESMSLNGVEIYNDQNRTPFKSDRKLEFVDNDRHDELEIRISFPYGKSDMSMHYRIIQEIDRVIVESVTVGTSSSDPLEINKIITEDVIGAEIAEEKGRIKREEKAKVKSASSQMMLEDANGEKPSVDQARQVVSNIVNFGYDAPQFKLRFSDQTVNQLAALLQYSSDFQSLFFNAKAVQESLANELKRENFKGIRNRRLRKFMRKQISDLKKMILYLEKRIDIDENLSPEQETVNNALVGIRRLYKSVGKIIPDAIQLEQKKPLANVSDLIVFIDEELVIFNKSLGVGAETPTGDIILMQDKRAIKSLNLIREQLEKNDSSNLGGIDLNAANLNLQIKRNGSGMPLPASEQPMELMNVQGFTPLIINVVPFNPAVILSQLEGGADSGVAMASS